jgi:hypothetical protein
MMRVLGPLHEIVLLETGEGPAGTALGDAEGERDPPYRLQHMSIRMKIASSRYVRQH